MPNAFLRRTRPAAVLLVLGAAAYSAWVLEAVLATGLDPLRTYVSELAASDQPFGGLFRSTDLVAGLLILAGALVALAGYRPRGRWDATGWAALALFGAATAADSRLPMSCATTADAACAAREAAGLVPFTHAAHTWSSSVASTAAVVGVVALTVAARCHGRPSSLARFGPVLAAAEVAATAWTLASIAAFEAGHGTWLLGAGQRLQVLTAALWLVVLAWSVAREKVYA
ncbi:hypothetical protein GCM10009730_53180 [Streptomyces albidochromogenes]|uniref:DUF998 domain-containing protein n=1 Tax=Streptomyces albidochromogenes TaxID=329524 RepID=UPI00110F72F0|nr:DUF998 domain-containing protein [Streptomyces albidochromogenes]